MMPRDWQECVVILVVICAIAGLIRWLFNGGKC